MPSSYTTHYQLNQWVADDPVQRTDFNADNAKIDAALKTQADAIAAETAARSSAVTALEKRSTVQTIKTVTIGEDTQTYALSLSGINWYQWREVMIVAQIYPSGGSKVYQVYADNAAVNSPIAGSRFPMVLLLFPLYTSTYPFCGLALGVNPDAFNCETSFNRMNYLNFQGASGVTLPAGSQITVYGLK